MNPADIGYFVHLIRAMTAALTRATELVYPWVFVMFAFLWILEAARVYWGITTEGKSSWSLAMLGLRTILLAFVIARWEFFFSTVCALGTQLGLHAGGGRISQENFLNPGAYVQLGTDIGQVLYDQWQAGSLLTAVYAGSSAMAGVGYFVAWVIFFVAFLVMALVVFAVQVEKAFALPALLVLLPFLVCGKTAWLGQGVVTYVSKLGFKFFLLALMASVVYPIAKEIGLQAEPDIRQALMYDGLAVCMAACFLMAPRMATNIMSGVFTLGAGSLANAGMLAYQTMSLGMATGLEVGRRAYNLSAAGAQQISGGSINLPRISTPQLTSHQLNNSLRDGGRYLHG